VFWSFSTPVSRPVPMSDPVETILQRLISEYGAIEDVDRILEEPAQEKKPR